MARNETRMKAAKAGRKTYLGTPCRVCGERERYTSSGNCKACVNRRSATRHAEIRELLRKADDES